MKIQLDMYQTLAVAVLVLLLGNYLKKKIYFLQKFCIPAPVIGGLIFAIMTCICYVTGIAEFSFNDTLREVCMVFFFTSVGFQANLKVLKSGGQIAHRILGTGYSAYHITKLNRRGACKALKPESANRHVHRLYSYGWRTWHRRSLWPGVRGLEHKGCHDHLYSRSYLRSHLWKPDRRTSWKKTY